MRGYTTTGFLPARSMQNEARQGDQARHLHCSAVGARERPVTRGLAETASHQSEAVGVALSGQNYDIKLYKMSIQKAFCGLIAVHYMYKPAEPLTQLEAFSRCDPLEGGFEHCSCAACSRDE